jgi:hypothetical protein
MEHLKSDHVHPLIFIGLKINGASWTRKDRPEYYGVLVTGVKRCAMATYV